MEAQVIKASVKGWPLLYHYGLVVEENGFYVLHNPYGQQPTIDDFNTFSKKWSYEETVGIYDYPDNDYLIQKFEAIRNQAYHLWNFNCEDFVNYMIDEKQFATGKKDFAAVLSVLSYLILK